MAGRGKLSPPLTPIVRILQHMIGSPEGLHCPPPSRNMPQPKAYRTSAYTSSDWWHEVVVPNAQTLLFPRGKTNFIRPSGEIGTAPGHGIALVGMGQICNDALRGSGLSWFVALPV
jgi:hypothetical protein